MTRDGVIRHLCETVAMAYRSMGDYTRPSDGFCDECPYSNRPEYFKNDGHILSYVRKAVVKKLRADGFKIHKAFKDIARCKDDAN